jgi:hypothetical protein
MVSELEEPTLGLRALKNVCLLFCLLSLLALVPGIHSRGSGHLGLFAGNYDVLARCLSLANALLFGAGYYGLRRRSAISWRLGWWFLAAIYSEWLVLSLASTLRLSGADRWIASASVVLGGAAVAAYWGRWWARQRRYFLTR